MPDGETKPEQPDNLALWNRHKTPDVKHTKPVQYGSRTFTAIDAQYIIQQATEEWGPIGIGWGWNAEYEILEDLKPPCIMCRLTLWYKGAFPVHEWGPYVTINALYERKSGGYADIIDDDAPKKAMTDALMKALSHLGFGADVYLGRFDDQRYVQQLRQVQAGSGVGASLKEGGPQDAAQASPSFNPDHDPAQDNPEARLPCTKDQISYIAEYVRRKDPPPATSVLDMIRKADIKKPEQLSLRQAKEICNTIRIKLDSEAKEGSP